MENASPESVVAEVATLIEDTKFNYHNVAKVTRGNFIGFYYILTRTSDTSRMNERTWPNCFLMKTT